MTRTRNAVSQQYSKYNAYTRVTKNAIEKAIKSASSLQYFHVTSVMEKRPQDCTLPALNAGATNLRIAHT